LRQRRRARRRLGLGLVLAELGEKIAQGLRLLGERFEARLARGLLFLGLAQERLLLLEEGHQRLALATERAVGLGDAAAPGLDRILQARVGGDLLPQALGAALELG